MFEKIKTFKLVRLHKNKYHIRNQHGQFSGNRCAYCHNYHGEISNLKCMLRHFCTTLIYQTKCVTMYIVCYTNLVKLQLNPSLLKTTINRHLGHALVASKYNTAILNPIPYIITQCRIISFEWVWVWINIRLIEQSQSALRCCSHSLQPCSLHHCQLSIVY